MKGRSIFIIMIAIAVVVAFFHYLEREPGPTTIGEELADRFELIEVEQIEINHYVENGIDVGYLKAEEDIEKLIHKIEMLGIHFVDNIYAQSGEDSYEIYFKIAEGGSFSVYFNDSHVSLPTGRFTLLEENKATSYIDELDTIDWYENR
ncbi:hypothetical protein MM326_03725 [Alkalihalobacillus sp. LMS6]|uniref:hypothetical protein n=1 Tax=Alkalihalobacillus sp. LMS6 TaxID=2924034 RepID=UPI0020D02E5C|nr:hypothetical protein [Alkalihalobacillus sp. LMS6]UTR07154.1 hypothetical protein MM326_03725 [Alkalihalobacillus sp. LMS6]